MLQRIQTVYMLGSVVAIMMLLLLPLGTFQAGNVFFELKALGVTSMDMEALPIDDMRYPLIGLLLLMFLLPLMCIFLYKKRKAQMRILIYSAILDLLFYAYFFLFEVDACKELIASKMVDSSMEIVLDGCQFVVYAMPLVSVFCCIMAFRGVVYDIALLASADRLRPSRR